MQKCVDVGNSGKVPFGACVRGGKSHIYFGVKSPERVSEAC